MLMLRGLVLMCSYRADTLSEGILQRGHWAIAVHFDTYPNLPSEADCGGAGP